MNITTTLDHEEIAAGLSDNKIPAKVNYTDDNVIVTVSTGAMYSAENTRLGYGGVQIHNPEGDWWVEGYIGNGAVTLDEPVVLPETAELKTIVDTVRKVIARYKKTK
jgi:hypothetical protein